jgi:hypothetical protein
VKYLALALSLVSFSAVADFNTLISDKKCVIEVTKDIIIPFGQRSVMVGRFSVESSQVDLNNNRRLKAGRILKIDYASNQAIELEDKAISALCFTNTKGNCSDPRVLDSSNFEAFSGNYLKLNCQSKPTIDI